MPNKIVILRRGTVGPPAFIREATHEVHTGRYHLACPRFCNAETNTILNHWPDRFLYQRMRDSWIGTILSRSRAKVRTSTERAAY